MSLLLLSIGSCISFLSFFFLMLRRPPRSTPFPTRRSSDPRRRALPPRDRLGPRPRRLHGIARRSEEHTSELQSHSDLVCRLLLEKKKSNHLEELPHLRPAHQPVPLIGAPQEPHPFTRERPR